MQIENWKFADELLYDTHYQWIRQDGDKIQFGLTPYGLDITGEVLFLALPDVGTKVNYGSGCGSLEAGKWVGRVYAPASGRVVNVNQAVIATPGLISKNPYECWLLEIELSQPEELSKLMTVAVMADWVVAERQADV